MSELLGRPIEGDINDTYDAPRDQDPIELFVEALDKLLDTEHVLAVQWDQYTDYFNDGEPCTFSVHEARVELSVNEEEFVDEYELYDYKYPYRHELYDSEDNVEVFQFNGLDTKDVHAALTTFNRVLTGGKHIVDLQKVFGDHATVTATEEGYSVDFCDHD